jgi:hypothetical protein
MKGVGPLYDELHALFDREYGPAPAHTLLAELASLVRAHAGPRLLLVTTGFDHALERALTNAGEAFDVVSYIALGRHRGKFLHLSAEGAAAVVETPNVYADVSPERRTVVLRLHGGVDREPLREWESFVVSEDDHLDYLAQADIGTVLPVALAARLRRSHFLFLGYPLRDWHVRVFLHRLWRQEKVLYRSWAIAPEADALERELWRQRGIDAFDVDLEEYVRALNTRLAEVVPQEVSA